MTENPLISQIIEFFGFTWVLRENLIFINLLISMGFKDKIWLFLLSGSEGSRKT